MGNLYGSEYWTYLLPKRVGREKARELTEALLPISTRTAQQIGLLDGAFEGDAASFREHIIPIRVQRDKVERQLTHVIPEEWYLLERGLV